MNDQSKKYPIYKISATWYQDGDQSHYSDEQVAKWPPGKIRNSTGFSKMFKEEQSQEQINTFAKDWWDNFTASINYKYLRCELIDLSAEYSEYESWVLNWFGHETFDVGQTDQEALDSFEAFVRRKEDLNRHGRKDVYCLMGAEDRWRWHGLLGITVGLADERTPPPCRCRHCKEQGVIRIGH